MQRWPRLKPAEIDAERARILDPDGGEVYWVNHYVWTYDPRVLPADPYMPFALFPRQEEFLGWLQEREATRTDGLAEKCRDVGFTWLCISHAIYGFLFRRGFACGFGSRKLSLVDKLGDPDSILEKGRMILRNLPPWQLPTGYKESIHAASCRFVNPDQGSSITGEGGDQIGRGGRKSLYFVDEAAFLEHPKLIDASLSATTNVRIDVSTVNGIGNPFYQKRHGGKVAVFVFDWRQDPRKGEDWYQAQRERLDPVTLAQEVDRDYTASVEGICIPAKWVQACVGVTLTHPDGSAYVPDGPKIGGFDVALGGGDQNVVLPRHGSIVGHPVAWNDLEPTDSAYRAIEWADQHGVTRIKYDVIGGGEAIRSAFRTYTGPLPFEPEPVHWGQSASDLLWEDGQTGKDLFLNLRAECWWLVRDRCRKTYEWAVEGKPHPPEEMISLPNDPDLLSQLSTPRVFRTANGKRKIESKEEMAKRGLKSPDHADALCYSFAPDPIAYEAF